MSTKFRYYTQEMKFTVVFSPLQNKRALESKKYYERY